MGAEGSVAADEARKVDRGHSRGPWVSVKEVQDHPKNAGSSTYFKEENRRRSPLRREEEPGTGYGGLCAEAWQGAGTKLRRQRRSTGRRVAAAGRRELPALGGDGDGPLALQLGTQCSLSQREGEDRFIWGRPSSGWRGGQV